MNSSRTNRRSFLKMSTTGLIAAAIPTSICSAFASLLPEPGADEPGADPKNLIMGIQLYSVRDAMAKDPDGTLKKISVMGYKNVEHANYKDRKFYGHSALEFKKILDGLGLNMHSGHTRLDASHWDEAKQDFTDVWKQTVEDAATVGQNYVISPWMDDEYRKTYDNLVKYMEVFNKCGELCKKSGLRFGYHNHDFEFNTQLEGKTVYEIILEHTDKKLVAQQIDIGNMFGAGGRALEIMKKHPGRFELMHVKDVIKGPGGMDGYESTILGKGVLGAKATTDYGKTHGGTVNFIIEQEEYQGKEPLDCLQKDLQIMKSWGYQSV